MAEERPDSFPSAAGAGGWRIVTGVVMRREPVPGPMARWQPWRWVLADVVVVQRPDGSRLPGWPLHPSEPLPLQLDGAAAEGVQHWGFSGFSVALHPEDAEGYHLNLTAPQPCFWVMWRRGETDDALPQPQIVTLSYHDAGRWLDAQELVDQVPADPAVVHWLADFTAQHYRPEPKRRARPASFQPLTDRHGQPARISVGGGRGSGGTPA